MNRIGWTYKKLPEIVWFQEGPGVQKHQYRTEGIKLLNVANLVDGNVDLSTSSRYISLEEANGKYKHFLVDEGDLIIASSGIKVETIEKKMGFIKKDHLPLCMNTSTIRFKTLNPNILNIRYFMYFLKSFEFKKQLNRLITGIAQLNYGPSHLKQIKVSLPPIYDQQCIISELDSLNDSITMLQQQVKDLDSLAQSLFYDMFGDPITNPKGWEVKNLSEIGQIVAGSTPSTADESNWDGAVNWVTPAELGEQLYYGETVRKLTEKGAKGLTLMPVGTVLLSSRAPIGKLAITTVPMCCNQGFKNIICNNTTNNIFLYYFLFLTMEHVKALGRGATFKEVSKSAISTYKVILPPLSLQQAFADRIIAIEESKTSLSAQISELQTLLASRMQYWFD